MSEEQNGSDISVYATNRFNKALAKLSENQQETVENEIDKIIGDPEIGERKKGDLSHLWVHKFKMDSREWLLGYSWNEGEVSIHLLQLGSHENYYTEAKKRRKADVKLMK
jgi:mRNA-degrading endonuclease RelE of RelBE toxin-antitoxin system